MPDTDKRVTLVALPFVSKQGFTGATVQSIVLGMIARGFDYCRFLFLGDHTQISARNAACEEAIKSGAEWVWFIDSDMDFPTNTLSRLKACNADIACTDMWSRNIPSFRTVMVSGGTDVGGLNVNVPVADEVAAKGGVENVLVCGMACTLIRTSILKKMKVDGRGDPFFWSGKHGEDATFCFQAKASGATIKCDFGVVSGHWGVIRMVGQDWSRDAGNQPMFVSNPEMMKRMGAKNV